jgi:hypothetical protein
MQDGAAPRRACQHRDLEEHGDPAPLTATISVRSPTRLFSKRRSQRRFDMPVTAQFVFIVSMDVAPEKEALFNEIYDREHVPYLLKVPGVRSATRLCIEPATVNIGGETKQLTGEGAPRYMAIYEIDSPDVLMSAAWAEAGEQGRWSVEVRPYTSNRHHVVRKVL